MKETLEKRIRELVPSLMELSFGCLIEMKKYRGESMSMCNFAISEPVPVVSVCDGFSGVVRTQYVDLFGSVSTDGFKRSKEDDSQWIQCPSRIKKIIGHPIQLHHVLQAINEVFTRSSNTYIISNFGVIMDTHFNLKAEWDLTKPLECQSDEVINFLSEILINN